MTRVRNDYLIAAAAIVLAAAAGGAWGDGAPVRIDPAVLAGEGLDPLPPRDPAITVSQRDDKSSFKSVFEGDIVSGVFEEPRGTGEPFWSIVGGEGAFTLREAAVGFAIGVIVGLSIAVVLTASGRLERALVPYVIASQTIPLIAIAPIIVIWGRKSFDFLPFEWQDWMSVSIIATYLTFFPVAINGLRGLQSPRSEDLKLMDSYAARWGQTLWRLRLPASLPYLFAAFKIAATASVVGAIVGEISAGVKGGLGRRVLLEAQRYTTGPERLYVAVLGAAALGMFVFAVISASEYALVGRKGRETVT